MSIIDSGYLKQDINLPTSNANEDIDNVITRYEPEILKKVLGYKLYNLIKDNSDGSGIYYDLINGKTYTVYEDDDVRWNGLKNTEKISLIADYVYVMWQKNHASSTSNVGETANKVELSDRVSPAQKMGSAWTKMRELVGFVGQDLLEPSIYNYLKKHTDDYPEWVFSDVGRMNMFGI